MPTVLPDVATLRRVIEHAVRAPSVHNSQPWLWRVDPEGVDLFADPDGALRAGEATSAVLLTATDPGLATTPLSQPLEVTRTRAAISRHLVRDAAGERELAEQRLHPVLVAPDRRVHLAAGALQIPQYPSSRGLT